MWAPFGNGSRKRATLKALNKKTLRLNWNEVEVAPG